MGSESRFISKFGRLLLALAVLGPLGNFLACSRQGSGKPVPSIPPGGVLLQGAGATFPSPLYKKWFAAYQQAHPQTVITYDIVGSGEGMRRFVGRNVAEEDKVDFGASDAALSDADIAKVKEGVVMLPVTAGGVVLAYNLPSVPQELKLSRRAYAGIFLGEIKNWNDPIIAGANPGVTLPKLTIVTVVRQDASGATFAFTKHLDAISEKWRSQYGPSTLVDWPGNAMRAKGNEGVAGLLQHSVGGVGYVGCEFAHRYGLRTALLENKAGKYVAPTEENLRAALASAEMPENLRVYVPDPAAPDAYPIATFTWILLRKSYGDPAKAQALRDLFAWSLADGQSSAADLGYVPLPPEVVEKAQVALANVKP
ncbi:MAG: phosphate ABC transporter substrate-binding protein PstS [Terriglobia bacterium]